MELLLVYMRVIPAISLLQAIMPRSYTMCQSNAPTITKISMNDANSTDTVVPVDTVAEKIVAITGQNSFKDAGRVHIGGGMMRFHSTKDAGRVHIGGGMIRF